MPVEIKELLVQAKLQEATSEDQLDANTNAVAEESLQEERKSLPAYEREAIIEACVARMKEWLNEQKMR